MTKRMKVNPLQWSLHWQILFSLTLSAIIALVFLKLTDPALTKLVLQTAQFFGDLAGFLPLRMVLRLLSILSRLILMPISFWQAGLLIL